MKQSTQYMLMALAAVMLLTGCAAKRNASKAPTIRTERKATTEATVVNETPTITETPTAKSERNIGKKDRRLFRTLPFEPKVKEQEPAPKQASFQEKVIQAQPDFQSITVSRAVFSVNYQQRQLAANGTITFVKDSILIVSVQPLLGIELLRVEATKDEIVVIDKMNRRYDMMSFDDLQKETGVDVTFDDIQAVAMNRLFVAGKTQEWLMEQDMSPVDNGTETTLTLTEGKLQYIFTVDNQTLNLLSTTFGYSVKRDQLSVQYLNHQSVNGINYPRSLEVKFSGRMAGEGVITMNNVSFNTPVYVSRLNLSRYKKVDLTSIISGK